MDQQCTLNFVQLPKSGRAWYNEEKQGRAGGPTPLKKYCHFLEKIVFYAKGFFNF
jgi:hypothetical protein